MPISFALHTTSRLIVLNNRLINKKTTAIKSSGTKISDLVESLHPGNQDNRALYVDICLYEESFRL